MFNLFISTPEMIVVGVVVVMIFGAKKVPEIARGLGKGIRQLKDATNDIKNEIQNSADESGVKEDLNSFSRDIVDIKKNIGESTKPIKKDLGL